MGHRDKQSGDWYRGTESPKNMVASQVENGAGENRMGEEEKVVTMTETAAKTKAGAAASNN